MYKAGDINISPNCPKAEDGDCNLGFESDHYHPYDANGDYVPLFGGVYLNHSCDSWVIGGPEQIRLLIKDLQNALIKLDVPCPYCIGRTGMVSSTCEDCMGSGVKR